MKKLSIFRDAILLISGVYLLFCLTYVLEDGTLFESPYAKEYNEGLMSYWPIVAIVFIIGSVSSLHPKKITA